MPDSLRVLHRVLLLRMKVNRLDEDFCWLAEKRPDLVVFVFDLDYRRKHRRPPKGSRCWQFRVGSSVSDGELVCVTEPTDFDVAAELAKKYAGSLWRERGFTHVYVIP